MSRIRLGMVGGGDGAFIGAVHRIAARLDDRFDLLAGALSSDPDRAASSAAALGLARSYASWQDMARAEAARPDGIEVVAIVTPNHLHAQMAIAFLDAGIDVICDKPLTRTLDEAYALTEAVRRSGRSLVVTYGFSGYPMIRQARQMVLSGALGEIRAVQVEYAQGWLAEAADAAPSRQARWRLDPDLGGEGGALGDIGTHAFHLAEFVTGQRIEAVSANVTTFVPHRRVPDDANVLVRFPGGANGSIWLSQIAVGEENALRIRVYGTTGSLAWDQESPDRLKVGGLDASTRVITRGGPEAGEAAARATRVPGGHPEGYLEAFAQLYRETADLLGGDPPEPGVLPTLIDGVRGVAFVETCLRSSAEGGRWTPLPAD